MAGGAIMENDGDGDSTRAASRVVPLAKARLTGGQRRLLLQVLMAEPNVYRTTGWHQSQMCKKLAALGAVTTAPVNEERFCDVLHVRLTPAGRRRLDRMA